MPQNILCENVTTLKDIDHDVVMLEADDYSDSMPTQNNIQANTPVSGSTSNCISMLRLLLS